MINFETAKIAKEIGFNIPVNQYYDKSGFLHSVSQIYDYNNANTRYPIYSAPKKHELMQWVFETFQILIVIDIEAFLINKHVPEYVVKIKRLNKNEITWLENFNAKIDTPYPVILEDALLKTLKHIKDDKDI